MRLKLLTNLNTLLLVAVCLALGATLWWSQQAQERPYLLMERYLSLSQHFQNQVARNIEDYLASGDAVRLSEANSALETLQNQLAPLPPALAETVRPSLENLNSFSNTELLAAGKLAGDPQALLLQAERELAANLEQLSQYASEANTPEAPHYLPPLMTASLHLAKLSLNRDKLVSSGRSELAGDVERELASIQAQAQQIDALPLLGVSSKSTSGNDDFAAMMGLEANQSTQTEDAGVNLKRELNNLLSRYPAELKRTQTQIEQRTQLSTTTHRKLDAVQHAIAELEPVVRAQHGQIQDEVRLMQGLMIGLILLIALLIDTLQRKLARVLTYLAPMLSTWAEGDFSRDIQLGKTNRELHDIEASLNRLRAYLVSLVGTIRLNAEQVAGSSQTLAQLSTDLHGGAERQAGDTAQIRDALGELEATISQVAGDASHLGNGRLQ
ncbi:methyl-accepting chemotaxis protein, partial [Pseudomonas helleri]